MDQRISRILELWYLGSDIALFQALCSHEMCENPNMACPVRTGHGRLEYNPDFIREMSDEALEEALRTEAVRILLKHPYERRPDRCSGEAIATGSNLCIGDQYSYGNFQIEKPEDFGLESGQPYEWYARKVQEMLPPGDGGASGTGGEGAGGGSDWPEANENTPNWPEANENTMDGSARNRALSELWEEDEMRVAMIDGIIEGIPDGKWGSLSGKFAEMLKASTNARIDWKKVFAGFRGSVLSSRRKLTRMRPSRRSGFEQMGSVREFDTKLLVAVDVSGSISSEALSYFYGVINSAFRYGFSSVDVVQFDCGITQVQNLKKCMKEVLAVGRGGTSFQEPIDYAHEHGYDGLVMLTDGFAPVPKLPDGMRCKIIWVCRDRKCYEVNHAWMEKLGRVCTMEIH